MFALLYLLVMAISLILLIFIRLNSNVKIFIIASLFAIFALLVVPKDNGTLDTTKYFHYLDSLRHIRTISGIQGAWQMVNVNKITLAYNASLNPAPDVLSFGSVPVMGILMITMTYFPNEFLLSLVTFCDYFFAMKIIHLSVRRNQLPERFFTYTYVIFCCLFLFSSAVTGIRNNLVGTIFIYYALNYSQKQPPLWSIQTVVFLLITLALILVHPFTFILLILFIIAIFTYRNKKLSLIADLLILVQGYFRNVIFAILSPLAKFAIFSSILYKKEQYLGSGATIHISSVANYYRDVARLVIMLMILVVVLKLGNKYVSKSYTSFIILLMCFIFGSIQDQLVFDRSILVLLPAMLPFINGFLVLLNELIENERNTFKTKGMFLLTSFFLTYILIIFIDNLRAGTLYYHFFNV